MSRTRIVKGKITEITGGTSRIFAKSIKINSGRSINYHAKNYTYGEPQDPPASKYAEFDIDFELNMDENTMVPFGILDYENNIENPYFSFKYALRNNDIDSLGFKITDEENEIIYQMGYLKPVIIEARKKPLVLFEAKKPTEGPLISKTWEYQKIFEPYVLTEPDYTKKGEYHLNWDGFDNDEIYDSTRFAGKKLKATITATKGNIIKAKEIELEVSYKEVDWVDVKIDKSTKRIDVTLRVNLTDGGTEGLSCRSYETEKEESYETYTPTNSQDPFAGIKTTQCDWDKISKEALEYYKLPPITTRYRTYEELEKITLQGINEFWSRNSKNIGKGIKIISDIYEVFVNAKSNKKGLTAPSIIYQTNVEESRSRNFELSRKLFFYEGYLYYDYWKESNPSSIFYKNKGWIYRSENKADEKNVLLNLQPIVEDYKMVSAHEIGHEVLLAFGDQNYSKGHKGTTTGINIILQETNEDAPEIPNKGEIDLMKYYQTYYDISRTIISEFDLLKVIWLTKIKIL
jgi:hypothetical protein